MTTSLGHENETRKRYWPVRIILGCSDSFVKLERFFSSQLVCLANLNELLRCKTVLNYFLHNSNLRFPKKLKKAAGKGIKFVLFSFDGPSNCSPYRDIIFFLFLSLSLSFSLSLSLSLCVCVCLSLSRI